jgi:hypothetical protein
MFEAMGLKVVALRSPAKFHPNLSTGSKVIVGTHRQTHTRTRTHAQTRTHRHRHRQTDRERHRDRQRPTGDLISLLSFLESRLTILKTENSACYSKYMEKIQLVIRKNEWMNNDDMYKSL